MNGDRYTLGRFLRFFALVGVLTASGALALVNAFALGDAVWFLALNWALFAGLTWFAVRGCLRAMDAGDFQRFQTFLLGSLTGKILLAGVLVIAYAMTTEEMPHAILAPFAVIYVPFLVLETVYLARASREKDPHRRDGDR